MNPRKELMRNRTLCWHKNSVLVRFVHTTVFLPQKELLELAHFFANSAGCWFTIVESSRHLTSNCCHSDCTIQIGSWFKQPKQNTASLTWNTTPLSLTSVLNKENIDPHIPINSSFDSQQRATSISCSAVWTESHMVSVLFNNSDYSGRT